jgi:hypothetical protein
MTIEAGARLAAAAAGAAATPVGAQFPECELVVGPAPRGGKSRSFGGGEGAGGGRAPGCARRCRGWCRCGRASCARCDRGGRGIRFSSFGQAPSFSRRFAPPPALGRRPLLGGRCPSSLGQAWRPAVSEAPRGGVVGAPGEPRRRPSARPAKPRPPAPARTPRAGATGSRPLGGSGEGEYKPILQGEDKLSRKCEYCPKVQLWTAINTAGGEPSCSVRCELFE